MKHVLKFHHSMNLGHGDISLENILLEEDKLKFILLDFGTMAKWCHSLENPSNYRDEGKLAMISPERLLTGCPSPKDDLYAIHLVSWMIHQARPWLEPELCRDFRDGIRQPDELRGEIHKKLLFASRDPQLPVCLREGFKKIFKTQACWLTSPRKWVNSST